MGTWTRAGLAATASLVLLGGCESVCGDEECAFTKLEWELVQTLSPLPDPPLDPTNRVDGMPAAVTLGQKLFFETRYSSALKVASHLGNVGDTQRVGCAACHNPDTAFGDQRSMPNNVSVAVSWTTRHTPALVNNVYYEKHGWGWKQDSLWAQASGSPETGTNSAGDRCKYAHMLWDYYRDEYNALFVDTPLPPELDPEHPEAARFPVEGCKPSSDPVNKPGRWEAMTAEDKTAIGRIMSNQGKAVAAYEAKLISRNAPFDRYVAGETTALSEQAKRGLKLFVGKASCVDCHSGPFFTNHKLHNLGIPQEGWNIPAEDHGAYSDIASLLKNNYNSAGKFSDQPEVGRITGVAVTDAHKGQFKTMSLRNVSQTAPYMHTGNFPDLRSVVEYYNKGGGESGYSGVKDSRLRPLGLTSGEIDDLVAFMQSLTGEEIPAELRVNPHAL